MIGVKEAKIVIDDLQNKPFICSESGTIITDSGYVIMKRKDYETLLIKSQTKDGVSDGQ